LLKNDKLQTQNNFHLHTIYLEPSKCCLNLFDKVFQDSDTGFIQIDISTDSGATWNLVFYEDSIESPDFPTYTVFDISSIVNNEPDVLIRFWAMGDGSISWLFDDVRLVSGDIEAPIIDILTQNNFTCSSDTLLIEGYISDTSGVDTVYINYLENGIVQSSIPMINTSDSTYIGEIIPLSSFGIIEYNIVATDSSVNSNKVFSTGDSSIYHKVQFGGEVLPTVLQDFETTVEPYIIVNPDNYYTWEQTNLAGGFGTSNNSIFISFFDNDSVGSIEYLNTHTIELDSTANYLEFDIAYAQYSSESDQMNIRVSTDGGSSWSSPIYSKSGSTLSTAPPSTPYFVPNASEWRKEIVDLSAYNGQCIRLSFEGISDYGNNLYLDNIRIYKPLYLDAEILNISYNKGCMLDSNSNLTVGFGNIGVSTLTTIRYNYSLNGGTTVSETEVINVSNNFNHSFTFSNQLMFDNGANEIKVWVDNINGSVDENNLNDTILEIFNTKYIKYAATPFSDGFELGVFSENWCPIEDSINGLVKIIDTLLLDCEGDKSVLLSGSQAGINIYENYLDLYIDLSKSDRYELSFDVVDYGEETHDEDGIFLSTDGGLNFTKIYSLDFDTSEAYRCIPVLMDLVSAASSNGLTLSSKSVIRFSERDNWVYSVDPLASDGLSFDDIFIDDFIPEPDGVLNYENGIDIEVFPNPFSSSTTISVENNYDESIKIEVFSIEGQLIEFFNLKKNTPFVIGENLPCGTYLIHIVGENINQTKKIVKL